MSDAREPHLPPEDFPPGREAPGDLEALRRFVNTVNLESGADRLDGPVDLDAWLRAHRLLPAHAATGPHPATSRAEWQRAVDLREALRAMAECNHDGGPIPRTAIDAVGAVAARCHLTVDARRDGSLQLGVPGHGAAWFCGWLLSVAYTSMATGEWSRLKPCRNHGCRWLFYDHSKNGSASWCSMGACGGRLKAKAYRRRRRAGSSATMAAWQQGAPSAARSVGGGGGSGRVPGTRSGQRRSPRPPSAG